MAGNNHGGPMLKPGASAIDKHATAARATAAGQRGSRLKIGGVISAVFIGPLYLGRRGTRYTACTSAKHHNGWESP
jgi:hypothetical protein